MLENAVLILKQILTMFILAGVGYALFRTKKISKEGSRAIANILIFVSLPCVIVNGFLVERTPERVKGLLISALLALICLLASAFISRFVFKKDSIAVFASTFSNPGFFGVPIIVAALGSGAVFYIAAFIAFINLGQWTYGVAIMTGKKGSLSPKKILLAPFFIATVIGLLLFFTKLPVPGVIRTGITTLAGINTALAMFSVGIYLAQTDILPMFRNPVLYKISLVRLLIIPAVTILILWFVPKSYMDMKLALFLACAAPVGSNVAVYAQLHNADYRYAVETIIVSTLLSVISLPLLTLIAQFLWNLF